MIPGMNPSQMKRMMQSMGMSMDEIAATKVTIETPSGNIVLENPQVTKMKVQGQETYQIAGGKISGEATEPVVQVSKEDIQTVVEQAKVTPERAKKALLAADGDIAKAIMDLEE